MSPAMLKPASVRAIPFKYIGEGEGKSKNIRIQNPWTPPPYRALVVLIQFCGVHADPRDCFDLKM